MHFVVLTLFKEMVETIMNTSIMGRALDKGLISLDVRDCHRLCAPGMIDQKLGVYAENAV